MAVGMTHEELMALPVRVPMVAAGRALGHGRRKTYELVAAGAFPVPLKREGQRRFARKADLLAELGLRMDGTSVHDQPAADGEHQALAG